MPYILLFYLFNLIAKLFRVINAKDLFDRISLTILHIDYAFKPPLLSFHLNDMAVALIITFAIYLYIQGKGKNAKKYRKGIEYGSARWGNVRDIEPYIDTDFRKNILLSQTERMTLNNKPKNPKYARNKNVLVVGGSGSGKTRFFVKPNIMQLHSSYVITDPKGTVLLEVGNLLLKANYKIKVLNTINFKRSMKYNPLAYIKSEKDILKLVNTLIANTKGEGEKASEDFWVKAERLLYTSLISYIYYEAPEFEKNFGTLIDMLDAFEVREDDEEFKNAIDMLFEELEEKDPQHFAVRQYKKFKLAAGKTAKSILISCAARIAVFDIKEVRDLMEYDELELEKLGDQKTALFLITSDTDNTFDFITALVTSQLINILCDRADNVYNGSLPIHVRILADEFANINLPGIPRTIAVIRSRNISLCPVIQAMSQLKSIYKDNADTIVGNCDTTIFLGGKEKTTLKEMAEILGKETIDLINTSESRGREKSHSLNWQKTGKELMTQDEISTMDGNKCIVQIRGTRPFFSDKFDITKHQNYKYLSDYDDRNIFNIEKYIKKNNKINPNTVFELFEINVDEL